MIIDCHAHIYPPFIRDDREPLLKTDPAFRLLYSSAKAKLVGAVGLIEQMDRSGVDRTVVFGFPWPGEEEVYFEIFERYAAPGAILMMYHGIEEILAFRK